MSNLKLALTTVREQELMELPGEAKLAEVVRLSDAFEKRMKKLLKQAGFISRPFRMKYVLLIAILAAMMTSAMSVQAIREPIMNFLLDVYEHCTDIIFQTVEDETVVESDYIIPTPPEGYIETSREELQTQVKAEYATQFGDYLRYTQYELDGLSLSVDTEEADVRIDQIQGHSVFMYSKNGFNSAVWSDGKFGYKVNATCSQPQLLEIVNQFMDESD